jgi:hypothetical protein
MWAVVWITSAALVALAAGCVVAEQGPNGAICQKNDDCESDHCISNICHPIPQFADAGAADAAAE